MVRLFPAGTIDAIKSVKATRRFAFQLAIRVSFLTDRQISAASINRCRAAPAHKEITPKATMKTARSIPFDKILQVRAPETLTEALDVAASQRMVNRSDYIRAALFDRLKADGVELTGRAA